MTSTHKYRMISIQYPLHKYLPKKSCLHCLRILIIFWLVKDPVEIMKEIMSWLFTDPINSGLAQFDRVQSNSKKTTNKIFIYLLAPFIQQKKFKNVRADPELWGCAIFLPKMAHLSRTKIFWYNPLLFLSSTYWSFSLCKI